MASTENAHTVGDLRQMQSLSLESKIIMTKQRIQAWYDYWDGYIGRCTQILRRCMWILGLNIQR